MNWNFKLALNNILYVLRTTFLFKYKYHCNVCGYPTDDINQLYSHGINSHSDIIYKKTPLLNNVDLDNEV